MSALAAESKPEVASVSGASTSPDASAVSSTSFTEGFPLLDGYRTRNIDERGTLKPRYDRGRRDDDEPSVEELPDTEPDVPVVEWASGAQSPSSLAPLPDSEGSCLDVSFGVVLGEDTRSGERRPEEIDGGGKGRDLPNNKVSKTCSLRAIICDTTRKEHNKIFVHLAYLGKALSPIVRVRRRFFRLGNVFRKSSARKSRSAMS